MYETDREFDLIGHTHCHLSEGRWRDMLKRDLDTSVPFIYAMTDLEREFNIKILFEKIINVDQCVNVETYDVKLKFRHNHVDLDFGDIIDSCERLGTAHIVDHWALSRVFDVYKNEKIDQDITVGVSSASISCDALWNSVYAFAKNNRKITSKIIIVLNFRNFWPTHYNLSYWVFRIRQMGFRVGFEFSSGFDDAYRVISTNRPDVVRFYADPFIQNGLKEASDINRIAFNLRRIQESGIIKFIARGVYDEVTSAKMYACGLKLQQGTYWKALGHEDIDSHAAINHPIVEDKIEYPEPDSLLLSDARNFFKGVSYSVAFSLLIWLTCIFVYVQFVH